MFKQGYGKPLSNSIINRIYECYEEFLEDNSIQKYLTYCEHFPFKLKDKPIANKSLWIPSTHAYQVFVTQYCGYDNDAAKEAKIKFKQVIPMIYANDFNLIAQQYPNNFENGDLWDGYLKKYDYDTDSLVKLIVKNSIHNDNRPIKKHEPLKEEDNESPQDVHKCFIGAKINR